MRLREPPVPAPEPKRTGARAPAPSRPGRADAAHVAGRLAALHRPSRDADVVQARKPRPESGSQARADEVHAPPTTAARPNRTGLPDRLKTGVEALSGFSLDDVRVHYGSAKPAQLQAHAYTLGTEIHLAPGQERHLPHEAWHVVQQRQGRVKETKQAGGTAINDDPALEREADRMGERALRPVEPVAMPVTRNESGAVQLRTENPYSDATANSGASTAHHIVPDTMLASSIERMGDEGEAIQRQFMPAFDTLTLRRLLEANVTDMAISYDGQNLTTNKVRADNADAAYSTAFGSLSGAQKDKIAINGLTFAEFKTSYEAAAQGQATDQRLTGPQKKGLAETFYEWQAGNIYAGPSSEMRMEPGEKDEFDSDAAYITGGVQHVAALKVIYTALDKLESEWEAANALPEGTDQQRAKKAQEKVRIKAATKAELAKLALLNKGIATPTAHDESLWYQVDSIKARTLGEIEGRQRLGDASVTKKKVPLGLVKDLMKVKLAVHSDNSHKAVSALKDRTAFTPAPLLAKLSLSFTMNQKKNSATIEVSGDSDSATTVDAGPHGYRKSDVGDAAHTALRSYFGV